VTETDRDDGLSCDSGMVEFEMSLRDQPDGQDQPDGGKTAKNYADFLIAFATVKGYFD